MKKIVFTFVLSLTGILSVKSQSSTISQGISLMLRNSMRLNITAATDPKRILNNLDHYIIGETILKESVFQIRSNLPWTVTVNTGNSIFNHSPNASPTLLGVHLKDGTGYFPLSSSPTSIMVGGQGNSNFNVNYKPLPGFNYRLQRIYNVSVVYSPQ